VTITIGQLSVGARTAKSGVMSAIQSASRVQLTSAGGSLDAREREMAQDVLSDLCVSYRALPERDRTNLGEDVEEIFQIMAEELVQVEGTEDGLLVDEVLKVFLGASTVHPLGT